MTRSPLLPSIHQLEKTLLESGVEIYAGSGNELQIAERTRMHLMDSGVRLRIEDAHIEIQFTTTAARSEHPSASSSDLFAKMREEIGEPVVSRGYRETRTNTVEARDPQDATRVLDVFYEIAYARKVESPSQVADEVRWVLGFERALAAR